MAIVPEDYRDPLLSPIVVLEELLARAGLSLVEATLRYSFFIDPEAVRARCPYFPDRARMSRQHYPSGDRGDRASWNSREVILGDNARAQMAWARYTGRPIERGSGYGVRHIWGNPWDPDAFTAGWNLCYMPYWLGMLTEDQHPHPDVRRAIQQVSFDLYFSANGRSAPPRSTSAIPVSISRSLSRRIRCVSYAQLQQRNNGGRYRPAGSNRRMRSKRSSRFANSGVSRGRTSAKPHTRYRVCPMLHLGPETLKRMRRASSGR